MEAKDGGQAFPVPMPDWYVEKSGAIVGMSLRDYFAAKAMAAIVSGQLSRAGEAVSVKYAALASGAYDIADAMLAERAKAKP